MYRHQFHASFLALIDKAFQNRATVTRTSDIYRWYGDSGVRVKEFNDDILRKFLGELLRIAAGQPGTTIEIQSASPFPQELDQELYNSYDELPRAVKDDLWETFYHFVNQGANSPVTKRIYVHAARSIHENGPKILAEFVNSFGDKDCDRVKIVGPGGRDRTDTIVAYYCTPDSVRRMLDRLKAFPESNCFADPVPLGTFAITSIGKRGVGGADECLPASAGRRALNHTSYGSLLADIIMTALGRMPPVSNDVDVFHAAVLGVCAEARVDPKLPYLMQADFRS